MTNDSEITIEFKGRHDPISERMQENASRKMQRLARYNDRIDRVEVIADHAHENPEVELIVHMRKGPPLVAKERAATFATAIDNLAEKMEKQLKRDKEKRKDHKGGTRDGGDDAPAGTPPDEETYEEVVRKNLRG
ncbi:MAG: ribosome-associated translation inhibitor RaiA [Planctomycetota bacterium]